MKTKARTGSRSTLPNGELIRDPARLVPLLERLSQRHAPLTVQIHGQNEQYTSYIVGVDRQHLLLDELLPNTGQPLLQQNRVIQANAKLNGIDIHFTTPLERVDHQENLLTNCMHLPEQIEYRQRRLSFRVPVPLSKQLGVIIENDEGAVFEGVLHDLSHGGAGMVFSDNDPMVKPGLIHECAIELIDAECLYAAVELRYSKNMPPSKRRLIGARFQDLKPGQSRMLGHCINILEREYIRKRSPE